MTVIDKLGYVSNSDEPLLKCQCDCGKELIVHQSNITSYAKLKHCGCKQNNNLAGKKFGKLIVTSQMSIVGHDGRRYWSCRCDCGKKIEARHDHLLSGRVKSCGCSRHKDIQGQRFGKLVVLEKTNKRYCGNVFWKCKCDCGNIKEVSSSNLMRGYTKSCGCLRSPDLTGMKYGKLVVLEKTHKKNNGGSYIYKCQCECGIIIEAVSNNLKNGNVTSCDYTKHKDVKIKTSNYLSAEGNIKIMSTEKIMDLDSAMKILHIVKCDNLSYARDLSYTPTYEEIGRAIEVVEDYIYSLSSDMIMGKIYESAGIKIEINQELINEYNEMKEKIEEDRYKIDLSIPDIWDKEFRYIMDEIIRKKR